LKLGQSQGYVRTFIDGSEVVRQLLEACLARNSSGQAGPIKLYLDRLLASFPTLKSRSVGLIGGDRRLTGKSDEPFEPLSQREMRILQLVSAGLSNQEIALALFVSANTVKTHLKRIYFKLSVSNRVEAVEKAHRLNLL
jgi:ATP/maltotriose-dependent transcriptional regulator MalT